RGGAAQGLLRRPALEARPRRPVAHAWRIIRLRIFPLQRLDLVIALLVGHEAEIETVTTGPPRAVVVGINGRTPALEDACRLGGGCMSAGQRHETRRSARSLRSVRNTNTEQHGRPRGSTGQHPG